VLCSDLTVCSLRLRADHVHVTGVVHFSRPWGPKGSEESSSRKGQNFSAPLFTLPTHRSLPLTPKRIEQAHIQPASGEEEEAKMGGPFGRYPSAAAAGEDELGGAGGGVIRHNRRCRDITFLVLFAAFWVAMIVNSSFGFNQGNPLRSARPCSDSVSPFPFSFSQDL
jgi:hypothetical protein